MPLTVRGLEPCSAHCEVAILITAPLAYSLMIEVGGCAYIHQITHQVQAMGQVDAFSASRQPPHSSCSITQTWSQSHGDMISHDIDVTLI